MDNCPNCARLAEQNAMLLEELESADRAGRVDADRAARYFQWQSGWQATELTRWRSYGLQLAAMLRRMGHAIPPLPDQGEALAGNAPTLGTAPNQKENEGTK